MPLKLENDPDDIQSGPKGGVHFRVVSAHSLDKFIIQKHQHCMHA